MLKKRRKVVHGLEIKREWNYMPDVPRRPRMRPRLAVKAPIIQKRMTMFGSDHPFFSK